MANKKTKKTTSKQQLLPQVPTNVTCVIGPDEMLSLLHVLSFSKDLFAQMALDMLKMGNEEHSKVYSARSQLSLMLYEKFKGLAEIGEPESKEMH